MRAARPSLRYSILRPSSTAAAAAAADAAVPLPLFPLAGAARASARETNRAWLSCGVRCLKCTSSSRSSAPATASPTSAPSAAPSSTDRWGLMRRANCRCSSMVRTSGGGCCASRSECSTASTPPARWKACSTRSWCSDGVAAAPEGSGRALTYLLGAACGVGLGLGLGFGFGFDESGCVVRAVEGSELELGAAGAVPSKLAQAWRCHAATRRARPAAAALEAETAACPWACAA